VGLHSQPGQASTWLSWDSWTFNDHNFYGLLFSSAWGEAVNGTMIGGNFQNWGRMQIPPATIITFHLSDDCSKLVFGCQMPGAEPWSHWIQLPAGETWYPAFYTEESSFCLLN